jgi:glycosyltransferase involved in cell wall biosynthesis
MGDDICKMRIEAFILAHNEERIMPYLMRHYNQFAEVVILENNSTDRTVKIAKSMGARVWEQHVPDEINDQWYLDLKDNCWKASRADWVIVGDADEFVWHPEIVRILSETKATIFKPVFFEMFTDTFPTTEGQIYDEVKTGVPGGAKMNIFRPSAIKSINYGGGCHDARPEGMVIMDDSSEIRTLHMRFLSLQYVLNRTALAAKRMSEFNLRTGLGFHYLWSESQVRSHFNDHMAASKQVIP